MDEGFAYTAQSGEQEGLARKKMEMKRRLDEENMSPEEREARLKMVFQDRAGRTKLLAELSKAAKITMQQAIDTATRENPGTVMESSLVGEKRMMVRGPDGSVTENTIGGPGPFYRVVILSGADTDPKRIVVLVNAVDGTIFRSEIE
jgi:hypothetical protein